jgi:hypothetical protein
MALIVNIEDIDPAFCSRNYSWTPKELCGEFELLPIIPLAVVEVHVDDATAEAVD